ncbi:hypothetical protein [Pseudooceanicola onchidii]|uniref:hypothetical protein n=1 Tax=Pseudooceanicola onchidii TaxID=2562279 RepID=UPI0010AAA07A|nr:hypothetical protein [Pseudooceanicola onchidii]
MTTDYRDLCRVTDAAYQGDLAKMQEMAREESNLRATLDDLDRQLRESLGGAIEGDAPWRAIGADEAWRKWLMRRRAEVNMQLARVLARKAEAVATLKRSFARKQVSEDILAMKQEEARLQARRAY